MPLSSDSNNTVDSPWIGAPTTSSKDSLRTPTEQKFSKISNYSYSDLITSKPKESIRNIHISSASSSKQIPILPPPKPKESALAKAKMFARQATGSASSQRSVSAGMSANIRNKNLPDLSIQALPPGRPSLSELSPTLGRSSKELERIASNAGAGQIPLSPMHTGSRDDKHKHHLSFRTRKDPHSNLVLSSSSSNSRLISEQGSIYSFHPSSPGALLKTLPVLDSKPVPPLKEDTAYVADESWSYIQSWVMPIFKGEGLRVPVEKVNYMLTLHLESKFHQRSEPQEIISGFNQCTKTGMLNLEGPKLSMSDSKFLQRLVDSWQFFFSQVLPYWEAVFLPLQLEFEGSGQVLTPTTASTYWNPVVESKSELSIRRMTLIAYRDWVIIPIADHFESKSVFVAVINFHFN